MEQKHLKVLLAILTVVATMGCTKEFGRNDPGNAPSPFTRVTGDEITFAALETKADVPMTQPFSVTAVWSGGTLMDEQTVSWNGSAYEYAPIKYWPQGCDEMSYNAYAPASAAGVDASSAPLYDFTLPEDASVDLMTAPTMTKTSNDGPVTFGFKHALSRISLIGYLTEEPSVAKCVRVTGIRINNQPSNGTWNADSAEWTEVGTDLVTVNRVCSVDIPEDGTPAGELYLLPGVAPEGTTLEIDWEIYVKSTGVASYSSTVSVDLSGKTFGKNTRIAGNLGINGRADIITFADPAVKAVCVAHWDTDGDGEISYNEASAVTDSMFGTKFRNNTEIVSFDELNYFTGVTALPAYSFSGCTSLESVNIVNCTSIGNEAFRNDTALKSIDLSSILTIGNYAFQNTTALQETASFPVASSIGAMAFNASGITGSLQAPVLATIGEGAFCNSKISSVSDLGSVSILPNATTSTNSSGVFMNCELLKTVVLPSTCVTLGHRAFRNDPLLDTINWDHIVTFGNDVFYGDTSIIKSASFPSAISIGSGAFYNSGLTGDVDAPNLEVLGVNAAQFYNTNIERVVNLGCVMSIPNRSTTYSGTAGTFASCSSLTEVALPATCTTIGTYAFASDSALTSFSSSSVQAIGNNAFRYAGMVSVSIPNAISIGSYAFQQCPNLETVDCDIATSIGGYAFHQCLKLKSVNSQAMTTVGESAFNGCTRLSQIDLENVETIGSQAFRATSSLSVVLYMPKLQSMTGINNFYQSGITGISSLGHISSIPAGAGGTNGNVGAFSNCTALVNVVLPEEMTSVSMYTFNGCTRLSSISGLEHITSYGSRCFNKAPICADASVLSNAEIIGAMAFSQAEFYGELSCPNLTEIGHKAFSNNTLLSKVTNLGSITTIVGGNGTNDAMGPFIQCELQELVIPSTVSSIGQNAVTFDVAGATLICNPDTPPTLNASAFQNTGNLTIYVPDASVDAYKAASVWSNYAGVIQGISSYNP